MYENYQFPLLDFYKWYCVYTQKVLYADIYGSSKTEILRQYDEGCNKIELNNKNITTGDKVAIIVARHHI